MSAPVVTTLETMGKSLLARLGNLASEAGVDLPTRQALYMTTLPADCEQVAVLFGGWSVQPQLPGLVSCLQSRWCATFGVMISRRTPAVPQRDGSPPLLSSINAAASIASEDAELLLALVGTFDEIGADLSVETPEPLGGYQAVLLTVMLPAFGGL